MAWKEYLDREQERFVSELIEFVGIPSVSAKPENAPDVQRGRRVGRPPAEGRGGREHRDPADGGPSRRPRRLAPCRP